MSYLNSITLVGFVGAEPEQRQSRSNGSKFTVFSVATQRSWKTAEGEWAFKTEWHRVCIFRPRLADHVATAIKKGTYVLVASPAACHGVFSQFLQPSSYPQPLGAPLLAF